MRKTTANQQDEPIQESQILSQTNGSITFVVDENLQPLSLSEETYNGSDVAELLLEDEKISKVNQHIVAKSFSDEQNLMYFGKDAFYQCVVEAYARHHSVTISPDMIWLLICQGFARYVNSHSEKLRNRIVSHTGKKDLVIESRQDLLSENVDWTSLLNGFAAQIDIYTKNDIAQTITSDFSTTGSVERIASQITLMETVKSYFQFIIRRFVCGIPTITIKGSAEDWRQILEKTLHLKSYGLGRWLNSIKPILIEFINAAQGHPNQRFWQSIVKRRKANELLYGGGCSPHIITLDGWLLKFFPDSEGKTDKRVPYRGHLQSEFVRVGFKYKIYDDFGNLISETPMELCAGFVGAEVDSNTRMLTPKIGWLVRVSENEDDTLKELQIRNEMGAAVMLQVKEVPEVLSKMQYIHNLQIDFTDGIVLPDWLDKIKIDYLTVSGKISEEEAKKIRERFQNISVYDDSGVPVGLDEDDE